MKRPVRTIAIAVIALFAILLVVPFLINANEFRPALESRLTEAIGRPVKLGGLHLALFSGGVTADDLSVADDPSFSQNPFLRAKSLKVRVEIFPLIFSRKLNVTALTIDQPDIALIQSPSGKWNFSSLGARASKAGHTPADAASSLDLSAKSVKILDGHLSSGRAGGRAKPLTLDKVSLELSDFSVASAFPFNLSAKVAGGGDVDINGKAGPVNTADVAMTPLEAALKVKRVDLIGSGFVEPSTGIAGLVSVDGTVTSDGRTMQIKGRVNADKWVLAKGGSVAARPLEMDCALEHNLEARFGTLTRGDIHVGRVAATVSGTYSLRGEPPVLSLKLSGSNLPLAELAADLRALDITLPAGSSIQAGTVTANLTMQGPAERLVTSGPIRIANLRLAGFNLGAKLGEVERLAGIQSGSNTDIQSASAELRSGPEGTALSDIRIVSPSIGELTGNGVISPNHALNFRMSATLHGSGGVLAVLGRKSDARVPFSIVGTSSNPSFRPDVGAIASQEIQSTLNKSLGGNNPAGGVAGSILKGLLGGKK